MSACLFCIPLYLSFSPVILIACDDAATCTEPDGNTFAVSSCSPQTDDVCPDYFFNSAPSIRGSVAMSVFAAVVCVVAGVLF